MRPTMSSMFVSLSRRSLGGIRGSIRNPVRWSSSAANTLYSWGTGDDGQLGHNHIIKTGISNTYVELSPKKIETFPEEVRSIGFKDIAVGVTHCAAVTANGEVYTWGNAEYGKLGHDVVTDKVDNSKLCLLPTKVEVEEPIKQIVCGGTKFLYLNMLDVSFCCRISHGSVVRGRKCLHLGLGRK